MICIKDNTTMKLLKVEPITNHKGEPCPYTNKTLTCQEGYCNECEIYHRWIEGINLCETYIPPPNTPPRAP